MGIPHLRAVLERFAQQRSLRNESLIIDGPGLAYHMHYLCGRNASYHSYDTIGRSTIEWLDSLSNHHVTVKAIYFDGYLPLNKLGTRITRQFKSTTRLCEIFAESSKGLPISRLSSLSRSTTEHKGRNRHLTPPFVVPAVLEALLQSPRYQDIVSVVPAEADLVCARHVASKGGIVITSDSDLLVHKLGDGGVAFLGDIDVDASRCVAQVYTPEDICRRIGVESPQRLGYEVLVSRNSTNPQLFQACKGPVIDEISYNAFWKEYVGLESTLGEPLSAQQMKPLSRLDPRISEMIHQLRCHTTDMPTRVFLPVLLDSPAKGTAWESTTSLRQLAYSLVTKLYARSETTILEYGRVQSLEHKGRQVLQLRKPVVLKAIDALVDLCRRIRQQVTTEKYWFTLFVTLSVRECQDQGKSSHVLQILKFEPQPHRDKIPWDVIHFTATVEACYYSLRILQQVLSIAGDEVWSNISPAILTLKQELEDLPSLAELPHILEFLNLLHDFQGSSLITILHEAIDLPTETESNANIVKETKKEVVGIASPMRTNNLFNLLEQDY